MQPRRGGLGIEPGLFQLRFLQIRHVSSPGLVSLGRSTAGWRGGDCTCCESWRCSLGNKGGLTLRPVTEFDLYRDQPAKSEIYINNFFFIPNEYQAGVPGPVLRL